jgi:hypothetical protein
MATDEIDQVKKKRHRSPNFPAISLKEAIDRAGQLYEKYKINEVPVGLAHEMWGYKAFGSQGTQVVAALSSFGLIEGDGESKSRKIHLNDNAYHIIQNGCDRSAKLMESVWSPAIYSELLTKYSQGGFHAGIIRHYLVLEREEGKFNPQSVDDFVANFLESLDFAGICENDKNKETETSATAVAMTASQTSPATTQSWAATPATQAGATTKSTMSLPANMKQENFTLTNGEIIVRWPDHIDAADDEELKDLEEWMKMIARKVKRSAGATTQPSSSVPPPLS